MRQSKFLTHLRWTLNLGLIVSNARLDPWTYTFCRRIDRSLVQENLARNEENDGDVCLPLINRSLSQENVGECEEEEKTRREIRFRQTNALFCFLLPRWWDMYADGRIVVVWSVNSLVFFLSFETRKKRKLWIVEMFHRSSLWSREKTVNEQVNNWRSLSLYIYQMNKWKQSLLFIHAEYTSAQWTEEIIISDNLQAIESKG